MFKKRPDRNDKTRRLSSKKLEELVLPRAKLRFCPEQLQNLNYIFQKKLRLKAASGMDKSLLLARSVTERLVQRLVSCVGMLDPRFSTKFLISSQSQANMGLPSRDLEYLVRLDCLSTPSIYQSDPPPRYSVMENDPDYPAAYARLRLQTNTLKMWGDCANSAGYLRRDRVQAKFVELLLQAANSDFPNSPLNVDESVHCGTPGKVVDACTLHEILKVPTEQHVFYGPGGNMPRFPDPRDFRRAIVDEPDGIRLRVEFLSPALSTFSINVRILIAIGVDAWPASTNFPSRITLGHTDCLLYNQAAQTTVSEQVLESYSRIFSINVRILIAIGVDAWPASTNFPSRITLGHTDCLLYNQAAQTGMYLVGYGVQSSAWQIRVPAAQETVLRHYGPNSTIRTILDVLVDTLEEIDSNRNVKKHQVSYRILNKYAFLTLLLRSLEESSFSPSSDLISWSPMYLSTHVLEILDQAIVALCNQSLPNYFFTKSNLMVNPGHLCEDDYFAEANNVKSYVLRLFDEALMSTMGVEEFSRIITWQESETVLLHKWKDLIDGLVPPSGGGGRRFFFSGGKSGSDFGHAQYTVRQLEYIGILLQNVLNVKQHVISNDTHIMEETLKVADLDENHLEDVIYLLVTIMDQARDQYLAQQTNPSIAKNRSKIRLHFCTCTSKLVETIRRDKESANLTFEDDLALVRVILKWLYKAMDHSKRVLGPILQPYLQTLFTASHSISWHLDFIRQRMGRDEVKAIGAFARLVNCGKITPAEGLIDAVNKNWNWARHMLGMVERNTLRVVFVLDRGKVYRHILSLPSYQRGKEKEQALQGGSRTVGSNKERQNHSLPPNRNYFNTILTQRFKEDYSEITPQHDVLKNSSPMTLALAEIHRRGEHRGYGDILRSLQSMHKLNMFQQAASGLPQEDRVEITQLIHEMQQLRGRRAAHRWSSTLPSHLHKHKAGPRTEKYTPKEESAGVRLTSSKNPQDEKSPKSQKSPRTRNNVDRGTLIGNCRAARIREDSSVLLFQDSFKVKSLLSKNESFKF